jgi:uncharacterized protein
MSACQSCGACCAFFRVDFSIYELDTEGGSVPYRLADEINGNTARMRGTDSWPPRCIALTGKLGKKVSCGIYEWRPAPCHEFTEGCDACHQARARLGIPPLTTVA